MQCSRRSARLLSMVVWLCLACSMAWAESGILVVQVEDVHGKAVAGLEIGVKGDGGSAVTDSKGKARIRLAAQTTQKSYVYLLIVKSPPRQDVVMVSPWDSRTQVPSFENESENFVDVVVVQSGDRDALLSGTVLKSAVQRINRANAPKSADKQAPQENPKANLDAVAEQFGLSPGDLDKAIRAWGEKTTDPYDAGLAALYARNYDKATADLQESLKQREEKLSSDQSAVAYAAFFLGQSLQEQHKYTASSTAFERSLALFRVGANRQGEALTLVRLGQLNELQEKPENFEKAIPYFTQALPLFEAVSDQFDVAICWWGLATAHDSLGHAQQAKDAYLKALPFFVANKNDRVVGRIVLRIGENEEALGNLPKAIEYYEQALPLLAAQQDGSSRGLALMRLGKARQKSGDSAGAITAFTAATAVWRSVGDKTSDATAYLALGQTLAGTGDSKGALDAYAEALAVSGAAVDGVGQVAALVAMIGVYSSEGDNKKALELEHKALDILRPLDVPAATNKVLNQMGTTYVALKDYAAAEPIMRQALAGCEKAYGPDHPEMAYSLNNLATLLEDKGNYAEAETLYQRALAIDTKALGPDHPSTLAIKRNLDELQQKSAQAAAPRGKN